MAQFINDTSIQTTTVFIQGSPFTSIANPNLRLASTAGVYYPSTDNFRIFVNSTDAFTIDSNGTLYGNGTGLTNLTYDNINGKPTNFQCDYNSTLINKPINFQCDYNSTLINKPTNFQCDYNSTLINKPSNYPADMTNIYTKTQVDGISTLTNFYTKTSTDTLLSTQNTYNSNYFVSSNVSAKIFNNLITPYDTIVARNTALGSYLTTATASSTYATITNLNLKESVLTFNAPLTRATNTISLDLSAYDTIALRNTAIASQNTINSNYFVSSNVFTNIFNNLIAPYDTIVARNTALGSYLTTATASSTYATITNLNLKESVLSFNAPLTRATNTISLDLSAYDTIALRNTAIASQNTINSNYFINSNSLNSIINTYSFDTIALRNTALTSYSTTSALNTLLAAKESVLMFNAPLTRATNTISLDLSAYDTIALRNTAIASQNTINSNYFINSNSLNNILNNQGFLPLSGGNITGNVGIGTTNVLSRLTVRGRYDDGNAGGLCINSYDGNVYNLRLYSFAPSAGKVNYNFQVNNIASSVNALSIGGNGYVGINSTNPRCHLEINGIVNINNGSPYVVPNNYMANGSLTMGGIDANYGGGTNFNANTAGLLMECLDNTEIAIHDANNRLASLMYYEGGTNNKITIGRDMGFGAISSVNINSTIIELKNLSYINFANTIYLQSTNTSKIITVANGSLTLEGILVVQGAGITVAANGVITWNNEWTIFKGTINGITNSLIFNHTITSSGINSYWYFNGTQTSTNSEISDERVKKEIEPITDGLDKFMLLKPKQYMLCEDKDYNKKFGIIAQDVEVDFPELIHTDTEYIANIYDYATYDNFLITLDKDITDLINVDDELKILLDNNDKNKLEIAIDDTPYNNRYKKRFVKVVEIVDNHSFKIDIELKETNVFVFGKKVNDFKKLDYQSLYCLNIAATQELYKIIQKLEERISILESSFK